MDGLRDSQINIRPERSANHQAAEKRSYTFPVALALIVFLSAVSCGGYFFYMTADVFSPYSTVYERLQIRMPRAFETFRSASTYLDQLRREPCDGQAIAKLVPLMEAAGFPRESAISVESFSKSCAASPEILTHALAAYTRVGDHGAALRMADALISLYPTIRDYRYWRGQTHERAKDYKAALADYISSVELATDLSRVALPDFYNISRIYDLLGRSCDAISPLETYLSYNVKQRQTQQLAKIISDLSKKGRCSATYASGSARIVMPPTNTLEVTINGARARMIFDTGATMVAITPQLALRARIIPDEGDLVEVKTVGGSMKQATGYAQTLSVGSAAATNVPLLIAIGSNDAFGNGIDGLLGMTYLSRFGVTLSDGVLELSQKNRN
jgi:tetratricopeptide (TPR) repeat protein